MARPDDTSRDVNRLYWQTDDPVTRLATRLQISRGTFYNHVRPLPIDGACASCGGPLAFRTRADRDAGAARCDDCDAEQTVDSAQASAPKSARSPGAEGGAGAAPRPGRRNAAALVDDLAADASSDELKNRLVTFAVGAAAVGLLLLFYSRRR